MLSLEKTGYPFAVEIFTGSWRAVIKHYCEIYDRFPHRLKYF